MGEVTVIENKFPEGDDRITSGNMMASAYARYLDAIKIATALAEREVLRKAEFENPNLQLSFHGCIFTIEEDIDLDETETQLLGEFIKCFDCLTIITEDDEIALTGVKHIYK